MATTPRILSAVLAAALLTSPAFAQSLADRIADHNERKSKQQRAESEVQAEQIRRLSNRMATPISSVDMEELGAKAALTWWSNVTQVPIVISWTSMQNEGIEPDAPVNLKLQNVPAATVLGIMLQQMTLADQTIVSELTPWYLRIMPRGEALKYPVTKVYDVGDLILEVPNFTNAPKLDLGSALGGGGSGGGASTGSSSTNLFGSSSSGNADDKAGKSKEDRAFDLAQVIRDTIEPDIWIENGGQYSSIQYFQGRLVVRAPMFVQKQIGLSVGSSTGISSLARKHGEIAASRGERPSNVSGVANTPPQNVSSKQQRP